MARKVISVEKENYKAAQVYLFKLGYQWRDTGKSINNYNITKLILDESRMVIVCGSGYNKPDIIFEEIVNSQNYELWI